MCTGQARPAGTVTDCNEVVTCDLERQVAGTNTSGCCMPWGPATSKPNTFQSFLSVKGTDTMAGSRTVAWAVCLLLAATVQGRTLLQVERELHRPGHAGQGGAQPATCRQGQARQAAHATPPAAAPTAAGVCRRLPGAGRGPRLLDRSQRRAPGGEQRLRATDGCCQPAACLPDSSLLSRN